MPNFVNATENSNVCRWAFITSFPIPTVPNDFQELFSSRAVTASCESAPLNSKLYWLSPTFKV